VRALDEPVLLLPIQCGVRRPYLVDETGSRGIGPVAAPHGADRYLQPTRLRFVVHGGTGFDRWPSSSRSNEMLAPALAPWIGTPKVSRA
jgi:hypothetical protein